MFVHFLAVGLVYTGLALTLVGAVSLLRPLRFLKVRSRGKALGVVGAGALLTAAGITLPAFATSIEAERTQLDRFVPTYQFSEYHELRVAAPPDRAFAAVRSVTASEITLFQTLTAIRRFGRPGPEDILNAPADRPILDVATETNFLLLALEPDRELVVGTLVSVPPGFVAPDDPTPEWFHQLAGPGFAKAVMNFVVEPEGAGTLLTTETRVFATDASTRRRFAAYWRVIYPGSALIRRMWLKAIGQRASSDDANAPHG